MSEPVKTQRNTLPGADDITRQVLPNGITVLTRPNFSSLSVVVNGYLATGALFDPDEKLGLAYFTALSLMRGTARRNFQKIFDALESVGASLGFSAGVHSTGFNGHSLAEDLPLVLDLMAEALQQPVFPAAEVERLRAQMLTSLDIRAQDTQEMSSMTFDQIVFAGHPYSRPEDGVIETIKSIRVEDLVAFHREHFGPRQMVIVVVGAVDPHQAVEQVERALGSWQNPAQPDLPPLPPLQPLTDSVRKHVKETVGGLPSECVGRLREKWRPLMRVAELADHGNERFGRFVYELTVRLGAQQHIEELQLRNVLA